MFATAATAQAPRTNASRMGFRISGSLWSQGRVDFRSKWRTRPDPQEKFPAVPLGGGENSENSVTKRTGRLPISVYNSRWLCDIDV